MFLSKASSRLLVDELPVMNQAEPATADSWLRRAFSTLKRCLREPLLHFLVIGLVLFGFYAYINRGRSGSASPRQIVLSLDELATMTAYFESQWHRPPTPQEFQAMAVSGTIIRSPLSACSIVSSFRCPPQARAYHLAGAGSQTPRRGAFAKRQSALICHGKL